MLDDDVYSMVKFKVVVAYITILTTFFLSTSMLIFAYVARNENIICLVYIQTGAFFLMVGIGVLVYVKKRVLENRICRIPVAVH